MLNIETGSAGNEPAEKQFPGKKFSENQKLKVMESCESIIRDWKKNPGSWLRRNGYNYDLDSFKESRDNKYRVTYVAIVLGFCEILCEYLKDDTEIKKEEFSQRTEDLGSFIRELASKRHHLTEEIITQVDSLAEEIISKVRQEE